MTIKEIGHVSGAELLQVNCYDDRCRKGGLPGLVFNKFQGYGNDATQFTQEQIQQARAAATSHEQHHRDHVTLVYLRARDWKDE